MARSFEADERLVESAHLVKNVRIPLVGMRIARAEFNRFQEGVLRLFEPILVLQQAAERRVGLAKQGVNVQCSLDRRPTLRQRLSPDVASHKERVDCDRIAQTHPGQCVIRVQLNGLLEMRSSLRRLLDRSLSQRFSAKHILPVRLHARGRRRIEPGLVGIGQHAVQRDDDLAGDFALHRKQVVDREFAIVSLRPDMLVGRRVDQLHVDPDAIAGPLDAAFEDMGDVELAADIGH